MRKKAPPKWELSYSGKLCSI